MMFLEGTILLGVGIVMMALGRATLRDPERLGWLGGQMTTEFGALVITTLLAAGIAMLTSAVFEVGSELALIEGGASLAFLVVLTVVSFRVAAGRARKAPVAVAPALSTIRP